MNNLHDSLPDLMRRATETLEPESIDLVERGMRRGAVLRRRRTALLSVSGVTAVLATAGLIVGSTQVFGTPDTKTPVAGTPTTPAPVAQKPFSWEDSLATLQKLLPPQLKQSAPKVTKRNDTAYVSVAVDDGKGPSTVEVTLSPGDPHKPSCAGTFGTCAIQPDGSALWFSANESAYPFEKNQAKKNPHGVRESILEVNHPNGTTFSIYAYNGTGDLKAKTTRATPLLTVDELKKIAASDQWVYPPKEIRVPGQTDPDAPSYGKPPVPVGQTLQVLNKVIPDSLRLSQPQTWGGGVNGFNAASYLVDDGKGKSLLQVLVTYDRQPVTECWDEGPRNCQVMPDHSVIGWTSDEPYLEGKAAGGGNPDGVFTTRAVIHYPDGRSIDMTSYNTTAERTTHTRKKPLFNKDQLLQMAKDPGWRFPGTGVK